MDFHDVRFCSLSPQPRRCYGLRIGRSGWPHRRLGVELEMVHMKAAAGFELRLGYRTSTVAEYTLTYCCPELEMAAGLGSTTATSPHVSLGLTLALLSPAVR